MKIKSATSMRDPDQNEIIIWEETTRTMVRKVNGGMPDFYEPETVNDAYFPNELESAVDEKFTEGNDECFLCPDTNQQIVRGWRTYKGQRCFYSYSYIGKGPYKADMDRLVEVMLLNMGVK